MVFVCDLESVTQVGTGGGRDSAGLEAWGLHDREAVVGLRSVEEWSVGGEYLQYIPYLPVFLQERPGQLLQTIQLESQQQHNAAEQAPLHLGAVPPGMLLEP